MVSNSGELDASAAGSPISRALVRHSRSRLEPSASNYFYTQHVLASSSVSFEPSTTGNDPLSTSRLDNSFASGNNSESATADGGVIASRSRLPRWSRGSRLSEIPLEASQNNHSITIDNSVCGQNLNYDSSGALAVWSAYCRFITLPFLPCVLKVFGIRNHARQEAWREKIGLVSVIGVMMLLIAGFTFLMGASLCDYKYVRISHDAIPGDSAVVHGRVINLTEVVPIVHPDADTMRVLSGVDMSFLFQNVNHNCKRFLTATNETTVGVDKDGNVPWYFPCRGLTKTGHYVRQPNIYESWSSVANGLTPVLDNRTVHTPISATSKAYGCHLTKESRELFYKTPYYATVFYTWTDIYKSMRRLTVYLGDVLDLDRLWLLESQNWRLEPPLSDLSEAYFYPKDISPIYGADPQTRQAMKCLVEIIKVGEVDTESIGCIASEIVLIVSLTFIFALIGLRFLFAVYYQWFLSKKMGGFPHGSSIQVGSSSLPQNRVEAGASGQSEVDNDTLESRSISQRNCTANSSHGLPGNRRTCQPYSCASNNLEHIICLITIYAEHKTALQKSLESLANTSYPDSHKLIFAVCDGVVTKNDTIVPETVISMMDMSPNSSNDGQQAFSYVAAATTGMKRHNRAKLYYGTFKSQNPNRRVPMMLIVKVGLNHEWNTAKPGNRGKRDSQLILMSFLQKALFDERMTDLENEIYIAMYQVCGIYPDDFSAVLMIDADTQVYPDSVFHMIECLNKDRNIVALCGETKIENKRDSWITRIQVFEYFISHHLTKAFESVFGVVTCLPGCFCMYRIRVAKGSPGFYLPILANPDIVERYADNQVQSLHKKNLLLLGEDRYLSTLMLKTFPRRKQVFISQAKCKTTVPIEFKTLLDQRRRWINSTIHNLLELIMVRDLCGVFCFSMQFAVFIELVGTVTLPAALVFTIGLLVTSISNLQVPILPLSLLLSITLMPGLLILLSGHKPWYLIWMGIYLCSLPIWNFFMPLNAFWKFDEFSWGSESDDTTVLSEKESKFDPSNVRMLSIRQYIDEKLDRMCESEDILASGYGSDSYSGSEEGYWAYPGVECGGQSVNQYMRYFERGE